MMTSEPELNSAPNMDGEARLDATQNLSRGWMQTLWFALSAIFLSHALDVSRGFYNVQALVWMTASFLCCLVAVAAPHIAYLRNHKVCENLAYWLLQIAVWIQIALLALRYPTYQNSVLFLNDVALFHCGFWLVLLVTLAAYSPRLKNNRFRFPLILLIHFGLGVWAIRHFPLPGIDVFAIQHDAAKALLHSINPYTITFPDPYHSKSHYYAEGLSVGGRLLTGYVYPPLSVLMALPGSLLGDVRYSNLAAITGTGALLGYARPGRFSFLAATFFLFMPQVFFVLLMCWTDAFVALLLACVLFAACRVSRLTPFALGLLLAVKQYLFLSAPLAFLLLPAPNSDKQGKRTVWRLLGWATIVALAVSLPLVLWNPRAYLRSAILLNFNNPFRTDSLNYAALWFKITGEQPSSLIGFVLLIPAYWLIVRRSPRTPAGFAGATALFYFVFFLFGRQAFINYYFVIFTALCGAVAVFGESENEHHDTAIASDEADSESGASGDFSMMQSTYS